ncbi:signal peptidase II [Candidatus Dojkabacteria bacterium]|nr:signal peptidase II [Candidatus Dojkabacteria bacterium]
MKKLHLANKVTNKKSAVLIVVILILIDQITKVVARGYDFGALNTGVSLGLLSDVGVVVLLVIQVFIVAALLLILIGRDLDRYLRLGLCIIISGGLSNIITRLMWGGVWDWIDLKLIPIFNLADIYIDIGLLIILYRSFGGRFGEKNK